MRQEQTIHHHLAKSYIAYFIASLVGLLADQFVSIPIALPNATTLAIILLGAGPLLMLWAQLTSNRCTYNPQLGAYFHRGPYRFLRNPTHVGLLLLVTGYTLIADSLIFFAVTLVGFLVSNIFFRKYEQQSEQAYGDTYRQYRSQTPKL